MNKDQTKGRIEEASGKAQAASGDLKRAPGVDTDNWPNMADTTWGKSVHAYYGTTY